jgi:hypothetical protein
VVLANSITDYRPVVTTIKAGTHALKAEKLVALKRQNFKALTRSTLERALNLYNWSKVYNIRDVDAVLEYVTTRIVTVLNIVAPKKEIRVKKGPNLYLARDTLEKMNRRDAASGKRYRIFRNEVTRLVRRDKQDSNLSSLKKANNDPKVLLGLADQALGKHCPSLPALVTGADWIPTTTSLKAAEAVNKYFVDKGDDLCAKALSLRADAHQVRVDAPQIRVDARHVPLEVPDVPREVPDLRQEVDDFPQGQPSGSLQGRAGTPHP